MNKRNDIQKKYVDYLQESIAANMATKFDSFQIPGKHLIGWRGIKGQNQETTIKSTELDSLIDKIAGPKTPKAKVLEGDDIDSADMDDLFEDLDYGLGYDNMENGDGFDDGLEDIEDMEENSSEYDELNGVENDINNHDNYSAGYEEDIEYDMEESVDDADEDVDYEDSNYDPDDYDTSEDDGYDDVEESVEDDTYVSTINENIENLYSKTLQNLNEATSVDYDTEDYSPISLLEDSDENLEELISLTDLMESTSEDLDSILESDEEFDFADDSDVYEEDDTDELNEDYSDIFSDLDEDVDLESVENELEASYGDEDEDEYLDSEFSFDDE
jgi:hypothetical protein